MFNPIHDLLGLIPGGPAKTIAIAGRKYELYSAFGTVCETIYRKNPGFGVGNPGFSLAWTPNKQHAMALGNYLAKPRGGVKRAEAEALVHAARAGLVVEAA